MRKEGIIPLLLSLIAMVFLLCLSCKPAESLKDQGITILSPKANDVVQAGGSYEILWKAEPAQSEFGMNVTVEFSKDGGKSWEKVDENVPNTGKYAWKVPKVDSAQCKIRVFSQYRPKYRGTSEIFTVK
jgi:galactose oxidase